MILLAAGALGSVEAQDLEPRRWSHLPTGLNVFGLATGATDGDIFFDPVLRAEDVGLRLDHDESLTSGHTQSVVGQRHGAVERDDRFRWGLCDRDQ